MSGDLFVPNVYNSLSKGQYRKLDPCYQKLTSVMAMRVHFSKVITINLSCLTFDALT